MINTIYHSDCLTLMMFMPEGFVDLTVTSPPYDNLRKYNGYMFDFEPVARELFRVTKEGGVVVWVVGDQTIDGSESGTSFKQALYFKEIGFKLHDTMIYKSHKPPLSHKRYEQAFEYMFVLVKGNIKTFTPIMKRNKGAGNNALRTSAPASSEDNSARRKREGFVAIKEFGITNNIWEYGTGKGGSSNDSIAFKHPAIFPEQLAEDHIKSWSSEGDLVFDPFSGSGTTVKMAYINNRNYIACDISSEYVAIANERISQCKS